MDYIYRFHYNWKMVGDRKRDFVPERIRMSNEDSRAWMKHVANTYRIVRADDPESFYFRFGTFAFKPLPKGKAQELGPPMHEYELHFYKQRNQAWYEIPRRKFYERIFFEGHGPTHIGSNVT